MIHEIRHYALYPGSFERMLERFREVNLPLFAKYGITVEQVWRHVTDPDRFSFLMSFPSIEARTEAWKGYHEDPVYLDGKATQATIIANIELFVVEPVTVQE